MITTQDIETITVGGGVVYSNDGQEIGSVREVYLHARSGEPELARVSTGISAVSESYIPLLEASMEGNDLHVPYSKDQVKNAPLVDGDGGIDPDGQDALYRYYGLSAPNDYGLSAPNAADRTTSARQASATGDDTSPPAPGDVVIRSEERLQVRTRTHETEKVRWRKVIVTEEVTLTVPVSHEEFRLEREPITEPDRNRVIDDRASVPGLREEVYEVILYAQRPVIRLETVPVERITITKQIITADQVINEAIRKERIDTEVIDRNDL